MRTVEEKWKESKENVGRENWIRWVGSRGTPRKAKKYVGATKKVVYHKTLYLYSVYGRARTERKKERKMEWKSWGAKKYFHKSAQLRYIVRAISGSWPLKRNARRGHLIYDFSFLRSRRLSRLRARARLHRYIFSAVVVIVFHNAHCEIL